MSAEKRPPPPAANDEQTALANLKALLLGPEQRRIEQLQHENHDPEVQRERVAESLPDALRRAYTQAPDELNDALGNPVSACIEDSVQRNPGLFADILYPVMGPAIRRSISQAMKGLVQQINQTLEHSLTLKGLKWRIEAARSGMPFAEVVLRHTLRYRVEEAFLIQGGSGLLIAHVSKLPDSARDADAVSAMLTAIRDFARDTLHDSDSDSRLETVDIGEHTLWLVHGPRAYLACAIRGVPPVSLRDDLNDTLEHVHQRHAALLDGFDGDTARVQPLAALLQPCLRSELDDTTSRRPRPWPLLILLLALATGAGWWLYGQWQEENARNVRQARLQAAVERLRATPGIVVTDAQLKNGHLQLRGLHDPLMPPPQSVLQDAGLSSGDYALDFHRFQSSTADAALARARQRLAPPPGASLSLTDDGTLHAHGIASPAWIARADLLATTVPGIEAFERRGLEDSDKRLQQALEQRLAAPGSVEIRVRDAAASVHGRAPLAWIRSLRDQPPVIEGLASLTTSGLVPLEAERLRSLANMIDAASIDFVSGIDIGSAQQQRIAAVGALIDEATRHAGDLGLALRVHLIGRTDGTGSPEQNHFVASERAARVAAALHDLGLALPPLDLRTRIQPAGLGEADSSLRRVDFHVTGLAQPADAAADPP